MVPHASKMAGRRLCTLQASRLLHIPEATGLEMTPNDSVFDTYFYYSVLAILAHASLDRIRCRRKSSAVPSEIRSKSLLQHVSLTTFREWKYLFGINACHFGQTWPCWDMLAYGRLGPGKRAANWQMSLPCPLGIA